MRSEDTGAIVLEIDIVSTSFKTQQGRLFSETQVFHIEKILSSFGLVQLEKSKSPFNSISQD